MTSPRAVLAALLKPLLPTGWKIIDSHRNVDVVRVTTVKLRQLKITRAPAAPDGAHDIEFTVTVTTPFTDPAKAEDDLDGSVNALLHALDENRILWTDATKVLDNDHLAYDITVTLTSTKD